jgi:hypothetical protein
MPDRVKMEMAPYNWSEKKQKFVVDENNRIVVRLNRLESLIIKHTLVY